MHGLAAFCLVLVLQDSQGRSLLDAARSHGGKASSVIDIEPGLPSFSHTATASSLILRGSVSRASTRLSDNQEVVLTQFEITPVRVYKGNVAPVAARPGPTQPLIAQRPGGDVTVDGLQLNTAVSTFPESESFRVGDDVFLFLSPDDETKGVFVFTDGAYGAYRIVDGQVKAMTKWSARHRGEQPEPFAAFENRVRNLIPR
jgi:hypothetical protein